MNFNITPPDDVLNNEIRKKIDSKTKPLGALGMLESLAYQLCRIQQTLSPVIDNPSIVVFAADHGIAATGLVNPYPQAVTAQMVLNFVQGGAAINVFCKQNGLALKVVDAGVNFDFDPSLSIVHAKIRNGTGNYLQEAAMTLSECEKAIEKGSEIVEEIHSSGCNCLGFGEMGIGNTSSASLLMSGLLGIAVKDCVGQGTGANTAQLSLKTETLISASQKHAPHFSGPLEILRRVGGFEIAMMTGAYLKAAELKMCIVVDGFIATAALLMAKALYPAVLEYCIFAHCSNEKGHRAMLEHLGVQVLLQLDLRLGEGTGAALAIPIIQSSVAFLNEMSSFESASVSNKL